MSPSSNASEPRRSGAGVLPLRGGARFVPSSVLVRARLGEELDVARVRGAVAVAAEVAEMARKTHPERERWWTYPLRLDASALAVRSLLPLAEVEQAIEDLRAGGILREEASGVRLEADVLCELPQLAGVDTKRARERLERTGGYVTAAVALLRELARLADEQGLVLTSVERLAGETLYGRTRVSQALSSLDEAGLIRREEGPARTLRLRLLEVKEEGGHAAPSPPLATPAASAQAEGLALRFGSVKLRVPAGSEVELVQDAEGREWLRVGRNLELGPL